MAYVKKYPNYPRCPHNDGVCCIPALHKCAGCGWNPDVEKVRNAKIQNGDNAADD